MAMKGWIALAAAFAACAVSPLAAGFAGASAPRETVRLTDGWSFRFGDVAGPEIAAEGGEGWQTVSVPHSWNRLGGRGERASSDDLRQGPGWYRLAFDRKDALVGRSAFLEFDGASVVADVWLNGRHLGRHSGAYSRFRLDATTALARGRNILVVRTDNSPPDAKGSPTREVVNVTGDWFNFGGLYRGVSLVVTDSLHFEMMDHGSPGVFARTGTLTAATAAIAVRADVRNDATESSTVRLEAEIVNAEGIRVARGEVPVTLAPRGRATGVLDLSVARPRLWNGIADPYLYRVRVSLLDRHGRVRDWVEQPLGIRDIRIDPDRGLILNGERVALRGVAIHQDRMGRGWAVTAADREQDFAMIREIGANSVRLAHYQHDPQAYVLADRLGLILWTEIPLVGRPAPVGEAAPTPSYRANAEQQLRELMRQNSNHPSVVVWGIGNEVNFDSAVRGQNGEARALVEGLHALAKREDPSRPTAIADCCGTFPGEGLPGWPSRGAQESLIDIADVNGVNRYFGWYYGGAPLALGPEIARLRQAQPTRALAISEYGAGGALTQHSDNPLGGPVNAFHRPHPEEYQTYFHEASWREIERHPELWASWVWNMFDFASPARQEGDLVDTNDKGLVSYDRSIRKDAFYFYKAHWNPEPMAHLAGRRYANRAYPVADIRAFSNASELALSVNGRLAGTASCAERTCIWKNVPLAIGANEIAVTGTVGEVFVSDRITLSRAPGPVLYAIPAGTLTASGATAAPVGSDHFFDGGKGHDVSVREGPPIGPFEPMKIAGGTRPELYKGWREGDFAYRLPVASGRYSVRVAFMEPNSSLQPGERIFDVVANGRPRLKRFDVRAAAGAPATIVERSFEVDVKGELLELRFTPRRGEAVVTALEIVPVDG